MDLDFQQVHVVSPPGTSALTEYSKACSLSLSVQAFCESLRQCVGQECGKGTHKLRTEVSKRLVDVLGGNTLTLCTAQKAEH